VERVVLNALAKINAAVPPDFRLAGTIRRRFSFGLIFLAPLLLPKRHAQIDCMSNTQGRPAFGLS